MKLTLSQTAEQLGKTRRQIRYMIQQGSLEAHKQGGRWVVDSEALPLDPPQRAARARREARLREAADHALGPRPATRWGLRDLKAIAVGVPLYQRCRDFLGEEATPSQSLRASLDLLAMGAHRYTAADKRESYRAARDLVASAAMALLLTPAEGAEALLDEIERELIPAIAGALRRTERRGRDGGGVV
jgi:excisionase family DNA binding protein